MLGREQFTDRKQAILNMSNNDDKPTLKVAVGFLLKSAAKNMKGTYLVEGNDQKAKDMDTFLAILDLEWSCLFNKALWKIDERKQEHLRRPRQLPLEDDVEKINTWMTREIDRLLNQYTICGQFEYNRLRAQRTRAGCHIRWLSTALPISWSGGGCGRYLHSYSRTVGPQRCIYYQERVPQYFYVSMPLQQPGSYQGGEMMMMKAVIWWRKPEYPEETTDILFSLDIPAGLIFICRQTSTHPHCPVVSTIH